MVKLTRHSGFTLVETLVSVLISVMVLVAATVGSRSLNLSAQVNLEQAQMNSIADTIFNQFELAQAVSSNNLSAIAVNGSFPSYGQFYDSGANPGSTMALKWAPFDPTLTYESRLDTYGLVPVSFAGAYDSATVFGPNSSLQNGSGSSGFGLVTSLVAVCIHPESVGGASPQSATCMGADGSVDAYSAAHSSFLLRSPWDGPTVGTPPDINDPDWRIYETSVSINQIGTGRPNYIAYDASGSFAKDALGNAEYTVSVRIADYHNPQRQVTRRKILSSWQQ